MDVSTIASVLTSGQANQTQVALATEMLRMNAQAEAEVAQMLDSAAANLANVGPGVGGNLDIKV